MKAIVYESNTGFTRRYAEMIGRCLELPVMSLQEALETCPGEEIFFLGWLRAGRLMGYKQAKKAFRLRGVCGVGLMPPGDETTRRVADQNRIDEIRVFYLQGGLDYKKLKPGQRLIMRIIRRTLGQTLAEKPAKTDDETVLIQLLRHGGDRVREENIISIVDWLR